MKTTLKAPKPADYRADPQTLGEHLKKRRRELRLLQKDVASRLGVNQWTYVTWENDKVKPSVSMHPRIINFLGYYPYAAPQSIGEALLSYRRKSGLTRARLAKTIGVDEGTVLRLERGHKCPRGICGKRIKDFFATVMASGVLWHSRPTFR